MSDTKKHLLFFALCAISISLSGCTDPFLPKGKERSVKILKNAIEVEFTHLTRDFDRLAQKGDLGLCAPLSFGVAHYAVYQAVEEKRTATMAQLTRFIMRARAAIKRAEEKIQKNQCVDTDGDGLTDLAEYRKYKTKPDNADTDGDKISDALEVRRYRTSPLKADTDGDLLDDGDEISRGLSPISADSDGDGFIDGIEVAHGSNARDACSQPLDAQNLDRLRECGGKSIQAKPDQVQTPQKRTHVPGLKTKPIPRGKRRSNAEQPRTRPSLKLSKARTSNIPKNHKKSKPVRNRNGSHTAQKVQTIQTRQASVVTRATKEPHKKITDAKRNHLRAKMQEANRYSANRVNPESGQPITPPEESPILAPVAASIAKNSATVKKTPEPPKPLQNKTFAPISENFPSAIFLRLW